jgi:hypothetical protein
VFCVIVHVLSTIVINPFLYSGCHDILNTDERLDLRYILYFKTFAPQCEGLFYMEIWIPTARNVRTHYVLLHYSTENRPDDKWLPTWLLQLLENLDVYPGSSHHYFSALDRKIDNIRFGSTCLTVKDTFAETLYLSVYVI